uniref:Variant surface glycoprotein 1125.239 n=1 Tax=Trypanosoma brucei TaxID=5691 RepID=A0A1J0R5H4_9TRYP|nr:variant surface glycoprotein 1125.239 [Trypanosoma brucei]
MIAIPHLSHTEAKIMANNRNKIQILLALIIFGTLSITSVEATGPAITVNHFNKICTLAKNLRKVAGFIKSKMTNKIDAIKEAEKAELKLRILAVTAEESNATVVYMAAAEAVGAYRAQMESETEAAAAVGINGAAAAATQAGRIDEFSSILTQGANGGSTTGYCIASEQGGSNEFNSQKSTDCISADYSYSDSSVNFAGDGFNAQGFPDIAGTSIGDSTATNKCAITKMAGGSATAADLFQTAGPHGLAGGLIQTTTTNGGPTLTFAAANNLGRDYKAAGNHALTGLYTAIAAVRELSDPNQGTTVQTIIEHPKTTTQTKAIIAQTLKALGSTAAQDKLASDADSLLKSVIGTATDEDKLLFKKIAAQTVQKIENSGNTDVTLDKINDATDLRKTLTFHTAKLKENLAAALTKAALATAKQHCKSSPIPNPDECKTKKEADCKDGCKLTGVGDNKKCVVDPDFVTKEVEGVKAENDGKTNTNTTGSNSFVINKAPLLLAVLLF